MGIHPAQLELLPGNPGLCLQPDHTLPRVQSLAEHLPLYRDALNRVCSSGSRRRTVPLAVGAALLAAAGGAAAVLLASRQTRDSMRRWWRRRGYAAAHLDTLGSRAPSSGRSSISPRRSGPFGVPASARAGGRRAGAVVQAIELAQLHSSVERRALLGGKEGSWKHRGGSLAAAGDDCDGDALPLIDTGALVLPQHEGQPLMLGRTSRSMVRRGGHDASVRLCVGAAWRASALRVLCRIRLAMRCAGLPWEAGGGGGGGGEGVAHEVRPVVVSSWR